MNYKCVLATVVFFLGQTSNAQSISSIDLSFNKVNEDDALIAVPSIKFDVENHSWSVGPTILLSFGDQIEEREAVKLTGFQIRYENFLHGKVSKWNLFHSFDFIAQRIRDKQNSQYFDLPNSIFLPNKIEQTDHSVLFSANVGALWNISEKLAATSMIGIGLNTTFRNTQSNLEEFEDLFVKQIWMLKLGLRYNLNLIK